MLIRRATLWFIIALPFSLAQVCAQTRLSPEEANKLLIEKANPAYPALAKATRVEGPVTIDLLVAEAGTVTSATVIAGHPLLKDAAVAAAHSYKYKPYLINGKAAPFITRIEVVFSSGISPSEATRDREISMKFFREMERCRDLLRSRQLEEAETVCKIAAQLGDQLENDRALEKMDAHEQVGNVLMRRQRYEEALASYTRALQLARLALTDKNAEMGQLYGYIAIANHGLRRLDQAREFYRKAENSLRLAYDKMACDPCDDEVTRVRQDYLRALRNLIEYHLIAAEQAGATDEMEQVKKLKLGLPQ